MELYSGRKCEESYPLVTGNYRALKGEFGITGLQGKNLGLWDYALFEIGITKISYEIGIMGFHTKPNWD